tara:strand:- start:114 stop:392 length:279 start_codon:yes stop_codon:yes gene_type:complete
MSANELKKLILREVKKLQLEALSGKIEDTSKVKAEEVDASEYADSIEQDIDFMKALKIHEYKLNKRHKLMRRKMLKLQEAKRKLRRRITKKL